MNIRVIKRGPYLVSGGIPLCDQSIVIDQDGQCHGWQAGKCFSTSETYSLCRCGRSNNPPFCDGSHLEIAFEGTEVANDEPYLTRAIRFEGPELTLADDISLCADAGFCERAGGIWRLIQQLSDPEARRTAIEEAADCPSGRLVVWDKEGQTLEPEFAPSIGVTNVPPGRRMGPLWVRGRIPIESSNGVRYEIRNRLTLCRCGKSANKPFCDGKHRHLQLTGFELED
jgi:CDGSH-type Zn-finger protein